MSECTHSVSPAASPAETPTPPLLLNDTERLQLIAELASDLISLHDISGHFLYATPSYQAILGCNADTLIGRSAFELVHPDDIERVSVAWEQTLREGAGEATFRKRHSDGDWRWIACRLSAVERGGSHCVVAIGRDVTERRAIAKDRERLLEEMTASEERYRLLVELCPDPIAVHSGGVLVYCNPAAARLVGAANPDELLGRPVLSFVHPDFHAMAIARAQRTQEERGTGELIEERFVRLDGQPIDVEVVAIPAVFAGKPATQIVVRDMTATKRAEESRRLLAEASVALSESLDYATTLAQVAQLGVPALADVCLVDIVSPTGDMQRRATYHADQQHAPLAIALEHCSPTQDGRTLQSQVLVSSKSILLTDLAEEDINAITFEAQPKQVIQQAGIASLSCVPLRARGRTIGVLTWLTVAGRRLCSNDLEVMEELARRAATAIDNAGLYSAEQQARQVAERTAERLSRLQSLTAALGAALTQAQVAEVVVRQGIAAVGGHAGTVALPSDDGAALEMMQAFGYPQYTVEPWQRFSYTMSTPLTDAARLCEPVLLESPQALAEHYPDLAAQYAFLGDKAWATIPLTIEGRVIGVLGLSFGEPQTFADDDRDFMLTLARQCAQAMERARLYEAERNARAEAQAALEARDQFLSIAAHELRTPLTSLLGYTQIFQRRATREKSLNTRDQRALEVIGVQAGRLNMLVGDLLNVARLQVGQFSIKREPVDLVALTRRLVEEIQPSLERHTVVFAAFTESLYVQGDPLRLEQVVQNLLQNAVKYSPSGGNITVRIQERDGNACVSVIDQGIGIPEAAQSHLFQRFYRADNVDDRHISGMGIGLYVVKEIVARHNGTVEVASREGEGSTFMVCIPLRET